LLYPPVADVDLAISVGGDVGVMSDEHDRATVGVKLVE
jgi:hypothetical protein